MNKQNKKLDLANFLPKARLLQQLPRKLQDAQVKLSLGFACFRIWNLNPPPIRTSSSSSFVGGGGECAFGGYRVRFAFLSARLELAKRSQEAHVKHHHQARELVLAEKSKQNLHCVGDVGINPPCSGHSFG